MFFSFFISSTSEQDNILSIRSIYFKLIKCNIFSFSSRILSLAFSVNFKAHTFISGTSILLVSFVTVPTTAKITSFPFAFLSAILFLKAYFANFDKLTGVLFTLLFNNLLRIHLLHFDVVLLDKNFYNFINNL